MGYYMIYKVIKAGKLANGFERGKGSIVHLSKSSYYGPALCGAVPAIQWIERNEREVTCAKCLKAATNSNTEDIRTDTKCYCNDCIQFGMDMHYDSELDHTNDDVCTCEYCKGQDTQV
jgi:hypothetical protein